MAAAKKPTRKKKSKKNKALYAKASDLVSGKYRTQAARDYVPPVHRLLPREEIDATVLQRMRGARTDDDCIEEILDRVSLGDTLKLALEIVGVSGKQWRQWKIDDKSNLKAKLDVAWEAQADAWADDLMQEVYSATEDDWQLVRMRAEFKKWLMGRRNIRYSDKHTIVHEGGATPIRQITTEMTEAEAAAAYADRIKRLNNVPST